MAKKTCETSQALSISHLKKLGYLDGRHQSGTVTWTTGLSDIKRSIGIVAQIVDVDPHFRLHYTYISLNKIKSDMDYKVRVTTSRCFFGGKRYWFTCPLINGNWPCQRRVGVLYRVGKYYGCRHCHGLAYQSQKETHSALLSALTKYLLTDSVYEKIAALRTKYWKGRPTKRHANLLKKIDNTMTADMFETLLTTPNKRSQK